MRVKGWTPEGCSAPFCLLAWNELVSELLWPCSVDPAEADDYFTKRRPSAPARSPRRSSELLSETYHKW